MSDVIGRGVIEIVADSSKLSVGFSEAEKSVKKFGDTTSQVSKKTSDSIDRYINQLKIQQQTMGMTARETELYKLSLRGASDAQLKAADSAIRLKEAYQQGEAIGERIKTSFLAIGIAAGTGLVAAYVAFDNLVKKAGDFQDMAEKTGDSAENFASLAVAAGTAGTEMDTLVSASVKLTKNLVGVDDESKAAGAAISALGLDIADFKNLKPADQFEQVGKALNDFKDGAEKTAVATALFGKSGAELLPFLKELGAEGGRQVILTQKQIELADEYADNQARTRAQIKLRAEAIATDLIPAINDFKSALSDVLRDEKNSTAISDALKAALNGLIVVFQTVAVVGSDIAFVFSALGREIGAIAAQITALAKLDLKGFSAISDAVTADGVEARAQLDKFQARILAIGKLAPQTGVANTIAGQAKSQGPLDDRKKLSFSGADTEDKAARAKESQEKKAARAKESQEKKAARAKESQEKKAQLDYDLEQIKKASQVTLDTYANAEKILQARRSGNLVDDEAFYNAKEALINANTSVQETSLSKQIERLNKENAVGKDRITNNRKIVDAEAAIAKARQDASTNIELNSIAQVAANKKIEDSYTDARVAANLYLDTIKKQNAAEVAGIGKGTEFRKNQQGLNQITDTQTNRRADLDRDLRNGNIDKKKYDTYLAISEDTYAKEVDAYNKRTKDIKDAQADWMNGANEAFANYQSVAENVAANTEAAFSNAFTGLTDGISSSIADAIVYGKSLEDSLKQVALNVADAFIESFIKVQIQKLFIEKTADTGYAGSVASQAEAQVALAGLNAYASTLAIPIVGVAAAPGAAAAATIAAQAYATVAIAAAGAGIASARGGFDIPAGVNPITQLHEKEMVLPQAQANVIRDMASNRSSGSGNKESANMKLTIVNNTTGRIDKVEERRISDTERALIISEAVQTTAAQLGDPNSRTSRSMTRNYAVQRSR